MAIHNRRGGIIIIASLLVAMLLVALPLPEWAQRFRPEWVALVMIYWCLAVPHRFGIGWSWCAGLFVDVLTGSLLGQHALAYAVVAYIVLKLHRRLRVFPVWQQALSVLVLVLLAQMLVLWVKGAIGQPPNSWTYWLPSVTSTLLWPWVYLVLRDLRRHFQVQ
ncbi:MAG: rod shape-determining protein MreD [Granulosicoccaceae bacterium]|jgi:rod shape-determining protein MreD